MSQLEFPQPSVAGGVPLSAEAKKKRFWCCCCAGCGLVLFGCIGLGIAGLWFASRMFLGETPLTLPAYEPEAGRVADVAEQVARFERGELLDLALNADDLNALLVADPARPEAGRSFRIEIERDLVYITMTVPIELPWGRRWLSGRIGCELMLEDGRLRPAILSLERLGPAAAGAGARVPWQRKEGRDVARQVLDNPDFIAGIESSTGIDVREVVRFLELAEELSVEGGEVRLRRK